jgi:hypothetical protein
LSDTPAPIREYAAHVTTNFRGGRRLERVMNFGENRI